MHDPVVQNAFDHLLGHRAADIRFDEHFRPLKYVLNPDGRLVAPVMVAMLHAHETVLFVPEAVDDVLELLVTLYEFDEHSADGAFADRWRIYHGEPPDVRWAFLDIDAGKLQGAVIDGEALMQTNPLNSDEVAICKHMNQDHRGDLHTLALHYAHVDMENPIMVGIDSLGIDIRGIFEVIRVRATEPMHCAEDARNILANMCKAVQGKPHPAETDIEVKPPPPPDTDQGLELGL